MAEPHTDEEFQYEDVSTNFINYTSRLVQQRTLSINFYLVHTQLNRPDCVLHHF